MDTTRQELQVDALALQADLAPYCATSLVTAVLLREATLRRKKNRRDRDPQVAVAEYLALLLLKRIQSADGTPPTGAIVAKAAERSHAIVDKLHRLEIQSAINAENGTHDQTFAERFRIAGLTLRNPGVPEHWAQLLQTFADDFDPKIERLLPFSLSEALLLVDALRWSMIERSRQHEERCRGIANQAWLAYRKGDLAPDVPDIDFHMLFARIRAERSRPKQAISGFVEECSLLDVDLVSLVDIEDVARRTELPYQKVELFLSSFAVDPAVNPDWLVLPSSRNVLSRTPFINTQRGYFVPYLPLLQWALLPRIEELLNPASGKTQAATAGGWDFYRTQRSRFLEMMVARILHRVSDSEPECNRVFTLGDATVRYEIDVLSRLDSTAYVAECKSTTLNEATWRGGELSLERDVRNVLRDATVQLGRSIGHLRSVPNGLGHKHRAEQEFVPMIVTLDHSGPISAGIRAAQYATATVPVCPPWSLSLLDLFTLQDLLETGWRFKHYARRRLAAVVERRDAIAFDELDYYHNYRFLGVCAMPHGLSHFVFVAPTDDIDDFYNSLDHRKHRKPVPSIQPIIRGLIDDLERAATYGWSDIVCDLLDLSGSVRTALAESMARMHARVARGGTAITRLRQPEQQFGIVYAASDSRRLSDVIITAQVQTDPMSEGVETYLIIAHDPHDHRVLHGVFERQGRKWTRSARRALDLGEEGLLLALPGAAGFPPADSR